MDEKLNQLANLSAEKRALLAKQLRAANGPAHLLMSDPIAIVGIGCRFPGNANSPEAFWENLRSGVDAISEIPADRWDADELYNPDPDAPGTMQSKWGGFIDQIDRFDPAFFGISPREASTMDPQQRVFLEVAWEALEHAGQPIDRLAGSATGVFVGVCGSEYGAAHAEQVDMINPYSGTGKSPNIVAGRLSYLFDLRGPSLVIDTACSSSLLAVHLACQSLRVGECRMALAGGVNIILAPQTYVVASKMRIMAPDGRCKTFDARANGYVRGEGCGVIVLKRFSDALADKDQILGLIRGSAVNQDGKSAGLTAPNGAAQQDLLREALANAGIDPRNIGYVEAHGTGTALGDPIEVEALAAVVGQRRDQGQPCFLGAVKTNIGHLEAAAGIAGLIKAVLALRYEAVPPNLNFETLNPHISLDDTPFVVPTTLQPWPAADQRRYAGINSFGWSGTNVHVVLEEAPRLARPAATQGVPATPAPYVLPLSARSQASLNALAEDYRSLLSRADAPSARDVCYAAGALRSHHTHRLAAVGASGGELAEQLRTFLAGDSGPGLARGQLASEIQPEVVFVFPGQGSQWLGMGRQLLNSEPVFRQALEEASAAFSRYVDWSLLSLLAGDDPAWLERIDQIQPALCAIQIALAALWRSWGVTPIAVVGHSMGEIAAASVAGALTLDDAARIICTRSRLLRQLSGQGAMASVELSIDAAQSAIGDYADRVAVAVSNSSRSTVLAGDPAALDAILARLEAAGVFCRRVKVDIASHSPQMDALLPELRQLLAAVRPQAAALPFFSTVERRFLGGPELDAAYWVRNLREPVYFSTAITRLAANGPTIFLEVSAHPILLPAIEGEVREQGLSGAALASLRRGEAEATILKAALGALYTHGYPVDWRRAQPGGQYVRLPNYPWQRERHWVDLARSGRAGGIAQSAGHPLLGRHFRPAGSPEEHYWEQTVGSAALPYLGEHQVQGLIVLPGAAYVEMALAAARQVWGAGIYELTDVRFLQMLSLRPDEQRIVQVALRVAGADPAPLQIFSRPASEPDAAWVHHATAFVQPTDMLADGAADLAAIQSRCPEALPPGDFYARLAAKGLEYGPAFQGIAGLWQGSGEALAQIAPPPEVAAAAAAYQLHPALLDACFQTLEAAAAEGSSRGTYLPVRIESITFYGRAEGALWSHGRRRSAGADDDAHTGDLALSDEAGRPVAIVRGLRLQRIKASEQSLLNRWLHELRWERQDRSAEPSRPPQAGSWLIFSDRHDLGAALADRLTSQEIACTLAYAGQGQLRSEAGAYHLDPGQPEAFARLLQQVAAAQPCSTVVYLWGLDEPAAAQGQADDLNAAAARSCASVLHLVQALAQTGWRDAPKLWIVTRGAQAAAGGDLPNPAAGPLWGLARTIVYEHPEFRCSRIDLASTEAPRELDELLAELLANQDEDQVALRAGERYVARLVRSGAERRPDSLAAGTAFSADGAYLITGGLGGLGLVLARWMVESGARHLALMGRSGPGEAAQATLDELAALGAAIKVVQGDVARAEDVTAALAEIAGALPPLRGIFHAAVVLDDASLPQLSAGRFAPVMAPKIAGAWNLHTQTLGQELDFFVLFSSAASLIGSPGQANYAAANAFLDSLAHYRRGLGLPGLSINWGPWAEVGQAAARANRGVRLAYRGMDSIEPSEGLAVLGQLLLRAPAQVGVLPLNVRQWRQYYPKVAQSPLFSQLAQAAAGEATPDSNRLRQTLEQAAPADRLGILEAHVREQIARVLGFAPAHISRDIPFPTLGFDSLMAIEFRNRLESSLDLNLPTTIVWTCPTIATLSLHLAGQMNLALGADAADEPAAPDAELALVSEMSRDELAELLEQELENLRSLTDD